MRDAAHGSATQSPTLWLARNASARMLEEAARRHPHETGGVLLGYGVGGGEVVVTAVVGPGPNALHERHRFVPDHAYHESEVARLYKESGRRWTYVGDWHSHPDAEAYLSATDTETLERIAEAKAARVAQPVMVILGQRASLSHGGDDQHRLVPQDWYVGAWRYLARRSMLGRITRSPATSVHAIPCKVALFDTIV